METSENIILRLHFACFAICEFLSLNENVSIMYLHYDFPTIFSHFCWFSTELEANLSARWPPIEWPGPNRNGIQSSLRSWVIKWIRARFGAGWEKYHGNLRGWVHVYPQEIAGVPY